MTARGIRFHAGDPMGKERGHARRLPRKPASGDEVVAPDPDLIPDAGVMPPREHPHPPWLVPGAGKL